MSELYGADYFGKYNQDKSGYSWEIEKEYKRATAKHIKEQFNPQTILDVGCASGFQVRAFREMGIVAHGVDISNYAISQSRPEEFNYLSQADIGKDPLHFEHETFDIVFSDACLEHVEKDSVIKALLEMAWVAKEWVIIFIPIGLGFDNQPIGDPTHKTYLSPAWWITQGYNAGLNIDLRLSRHYCDESTKYHNAELYFRKGSLYQRITHE